MSSVKNLEEGTHWEFMELLMIMRQKINSVHLLQKDQNRAVAGRDAVSLGFVISRERKCAFSLDFWPIGLSVLDRARSKVALRGEGYAWTLIWWSSDNSKR